LLFAPAVVAHHRWTNENRLADADADADHNLFWF